MNGYNHPDDLYADALAKIRVHTGKPTGAYQAAPEMSAAERKLRTALAYVNHARDLINEALKLAEDERKPVPPEVHRAQKMAYDMAAEERRVPRWHTDYPKSQHPMNAEALREFERDDNASGV